MKKALIAIRSKKGHTRKYGEEIGKYLRGKGLEITIMDVEELKTDHLRDGSFLFLGCWTGGIYIMLQHPDRVWINAINGVTIPENVKTGLFTTYKLATGSMFKAMKKHIPALKDKTIPEWKSKNTVLSESDREALDLFIKD